MLIVFERKVLGRRAALARETLSALHAPPNAPPLPIGYDEREETKRQHWNTRELVRAIGGKSKYDMAEHPPFDEYARGRWLRAQWPFRVERGRTAEEVLPAMRTLGVGAGTVLGAGTPKARPVSRRCTSKPKARSMQWSGLNLRRKRCHYCRSCEQSAWKWKARPIRGWPPLQRVRGKVEFDGHGACQQPDPSRHARGASAQPHSGDIPASGEVDGGVGLDGCTGPRPDRGGYKEQIRGYVRRARTSSTPN